MEENQSARDCETLSYSIQADLSGLPPFSKGSFISKVPKQLRQVNEAAFTPLILSIGPLHHKDESLLPMEALKLNYLKSFLAASSANADLAAFLRAIINRQSKIRDCYTDPIQLSTKEFARMVLTDGAFIIELFRKSSNPSLREDGDPIFRGSPKLAAVRRDLQLAENQLPSFILVDLYWMAFKTGSDNPDAFVDIASEFFGLDKPCDSAERKEIDNDDAGCHLLALSKNQYAHESTIDLLGTPRRGTIACLTATRLFEAGVKFWARCWQNRRGAIMCPTATRLFEAGVKFQVERRRNHFETNRWCRCATTFNVGTRVLTIPKLKLTDESGVSLRNSIAFEQCGSCADRPVTDYVCFVDCLIDTARDFELLVEAGVVENHMGDDEGAVELINSLCKHVDVSPYLRISYGRVCADLNEYYANWWTRHKVTLNRHKATLKETYFSHPWAAISVVYAFVMLLLAIAQVVTGVISMR